MCDPAKIFFHIQVGIHFWFEKNNFVTKFFWIQLYFAAIKFWLEKACG
jgi:hypothetical protein